MDYTATTVDDVSESEDDAMESESFEDYEQGFHDDPINNTHGGVAYIVDCSNFSIR